MRRALGSALLALQGADLSRERVSPVSLERSMNAFAGRTGRSPLYDRSIFKSVRSPLASDITAPQAMNYR